MEIDFFNPVVEDWTEECMVEELKQRKECDYVLYVITPEMEGVYSIAEVVDDSNKRPEKTVFCVIEEILQGNLPISFMRTQRKSFDAVSKMVKSNGANVFGSLQEVADFLNKQ